MGCEFGWYLDRDEPMMALACLGDEAARVAHAEGVRLGYHGVRNMDDCEFNETRNAETMIEFYRPIWNLSSRRLKASMLQDLEKGRPCEIDYINGEVIRAGRKHGIPTPYNDLLAALVKLAESRKLVWTPEEIMPLFRPLLQVDGYAAD